MAKSMRERITSEHSWKAITVLVIAAGCSTDDRTTATESPLSTPAPGDTLTIGFEVDAADQPIPRGTYIDEQFAAIGVHFNGAFAVGARPIDFPNYTVAPLTDAMICTWVAWQDSGLWAMYWSFSTARGRRDSGWRRLMWWMRRARRMRRGWRWKGARMIRTRADHGGGQSRHRGQSGARCE